MPGFGLLLDTTPHDGAAEHFRQGLAAMRFDDRCRSHISAADHPIWLGWTVYDGYPIRAWQSAQFHAVLEGMVYDRDWDDLSSRLAAIDSGRDPTEEARRLVHDWAAAADGDFAIVIATRIPPHGVIVALDALGRLPVYWSHADGRLAVGRAVKFIASVVSSVQPDRTGIAQLLAMGFPWEDRTLLSGVRRLPPGTILSWREGDTLPPNLESRIWNFDCGPAEGRMTGFAGELVDRFLTATRQRVYACSDRPLILSLSGGIDSRSVAAAFHRLDVGATARTFAYPGYQSPREVTSAREIADLCRLPWRVVPLTAPSAEACERLVRLKDGLNSAAMAYAESYLTVLVAESGPNSVLFSGGGGDLALVPRHPERLLHSVHELADLLLSRNLVFQPRLLMEAMGITRRDLQTQLAAWLESCPETDLADKYLHFCFAGYEYKSYFEGEDRNRAYLWTAAPFYSRTFFERAMRAPFAWKRRRRLALEFLRQLNPQVASVRNANTGYVPGGVRDRLRQWSRELALSRASWERAARKWRRRHASRAPFPSVPGAQLAETIRSSPSVGEMFDRDRLLAWVADLPHAAQLWPLYTVVRYLRLLD